MNNGVPDEIILGILGFISVMIAIITPIIKLNKNIVELTVTLKNLENTYVENNKKLEKKISDHDEAIVGLEKTTLAHELRLKTIEKE